MADNPKDIFEDGVVTDDELHDANVSLADRQRAYDEATRKADFHGQFRNVFLCIGGAGMIFGFVGESAAIGLSSLAVGGLGAIVFSSLQQRFRGMCQSAVNHPRVIVDENGRPDALKPLPRKA